MLRESPFRKAHFGSCLRTCDSLAVLPGLDTVSSDDTTCIAISLPLQDIPHEMASYSGIFRTLILVRLMTASKPCG